jgi:hypothetical protein
VNGPATMMAMAFVKSIATPMKVVGQACAISYVPSEVFIRNTCPVCRHHEFSVNLKQVSPAFVSAIVRLH